MTSTNGNSSSTEAVAAATAPKLIEHIHLPLDYTPFEVKWVPESSRLVSLGAHASGASTVSVGPSMCV